MKKQIFWRIFTLSFLVSQTISLVGAMVITGDSEVAGETFSFKIDTHIQDQQGLIRTRTLMPSGSLLFFGAEASAAGSSKDFAVSVLSRGKDSIKGLTPETVMLGADKNVPNPLYDKGIKYLGLLEGESNIRGEHQRPIVVVDGDETNLYLINLYEHSLNQVLVAPDLKDADSAITSGIVGVAGGPTGTMFAAVGPNGGAFGNPGSGVSVVMLGTVESGDAESTFFRDIDANTGLFGTTGKAIPLDITSDQLKIGSDLASLGTVIDMHWDYNFSRLYIALEAISGADAADGARSVVVGHFEYRVDENGKKQRTNKLVLKEIAPAAAFTGADKIVGATGADQEVTAHKVRTMFTSTGLNYLIVQGGVGASENTRMKVSALPLVTNNEDDSLNGTIAKKDVAPTDIFNQTTNRFLARSFKEPAVVATDMPLSSDACTCVGNDELDDFIITDIYVWRDTVYATVQGDHSFMVYSQALFNEKGAIKGWTPWRVASITINDAITPDFDDISSSFLDPATGQFIIAAVNPSGNTVLKRTQFADGDEKISAPLVTTLANEFPQTEGGILGVQSLPFNAPGIVDTSLLLLTGNNKVVIAEISRDDIVTTANEYETIQRFTDGSITQDFMGFPDTKIVSISGGALSNIGAIQASTIGINDSDGWLFVGGTNGLAVLSKANGDGWSTQDELGINFEGLTDGMSFKTIGNYSFVRKLIYDGNHFLYVLTDDRLDRIDLTSGNVGLDDLVVVTLATRDQFSISNGTFHDVIVSEKLALLASTAGLWRVGDGANIQMASDQSEVHWRRIALSDQDDIPYQLITVTQSPFETNVARSTIGGMVYVLATNRGFNTGRLYRFSINNVTSGAVDQNTVQPIADLFFENEPSFLASFGQFREHFVTDGALLMHARSQNNTISPNVQTLPLEARSGVSLARMHLGSFPIPVDLKSGTDVNAFGRNMASGAFFIAGDFGLKINE